MRGARLRAPADDDVHVGPAEARRIDELVVRALEAEAVLVQQPVHDLQLFGEPRHTLARAAELESVRLVLARLPPGAHPDADSATGDLVSRRRVPREDGGMAKGV